jgi:hypothetical protein
LTEISDEKRFEYEQEISKIRIEVLKKYEEYNKTMKYLACDAPIGVLCLPKVIETILIDNGYDRIYDLFDMDFTKIKGLGVVRCRDLAASLDEFLSML